MKRKTKSEQYRQEYFKIRRSAERFIHNATKRGYSMAELPKVPKTITKQSVESLRRRTERTYLYSKSTFTYYNPEFNRTYTVSGDIGKSVERSLAAKKAAKTRYYKKYINDRFNQWKRENAERTEQIRDDWERRKEVEDQKKLADSIPEFIEFSDDELVNTRTGEIIPKSEIVDYNVVNRIYDRLQAMPEEGVPDKGGDWHRELFYTKNDIINSFDEIISNAKNEGTHDEYVKYLNDKEGELNMAFDSMEDAYYYEQLFRDMGTVSKILQNHPLTAEQSQRIGETSDRYSYSPEDELL